MCVKMTKMLLNPWYYITHTHTTLYHKGDGRSDARFPLQWRHNGRDSVSNHQPHDCSLNRLFRRRSKKTSKLRVTGLCAGNSPVTGEFPAQMASNAENGSILTHYFLEMNGGDILTVKAPGHLKASLWPTGCPVHIHPHHTMVASNWHILMLFLTTLLTS